MTKRICFTGGGSIGHVSLNVAMIPYFQEQGYETFYIGSKKGIEREMISELDNVDYYAISSGKLRRYFAVKNFTDPFRVTKGVTDAYRILRKLRPTLVFSKGGFVSVPVAIAAKMLKIPVLLHESDVTPGLANKINIKFSNHIFTTFKQAADLLPSNLATPIGSIIRENLFHGDKDKGYALTGLDNKKSILTVMGGSLGSAAINQAIRENLQHLLEKFHIVHLTGKGLKDDAITIPGYVQYEFVTNELTDLLAMTDYVISRAGSNSIFEFLALQIPMLLIPLTAGASRGDQILNAKYFKEKGYALVLEEDKAPEQLVKTLDNLVESSNQMREEMANYKMRYTIKDFYNEIIKFER